MLACPTTYANLMGSKPALRVPNPDDRDERNGDESCHRGRRRRRRTSRRDQDNGGERESEPLDHKTHAVSFPVASLFLAARGGSPFRSGQTRFDRFTCMGTERGMDRLIFFTDAVTAIAITLLILPLVDLVPHGGADFTISGFVQDNGGQIFAFVLSFVIIARLWIANHGALEHVLRATPTLMWLNIAWAFTIVLLPLPTAITAATHPAPGPVGLYIGTMTANSILLTAICWVIYKHPETESGEGAAARKERLVGNAATSGAFIIALIVGTSVPQISYFALFALLLTTPFDMIVKPRIRPTTRPSPRS